MPDTDSITIVKRFSYRGTDEEWSNSYHLDGVTPTTDAEWKTLADAIIASEKTCVGSHVTYVRAYGYEAGNEHSVSTVDYVALGGTLVVGTGSGNTGNSKNAGDVAACLRAKRATKSVKGKPVYARKYFHGVAHATATPDAVGPDYKPAIVAHGAKMLDGTLPGGMKWVAPQGEALSNPQCNPFMTTRTLKRRGKRPTPAG